MMLSFKEADNLGRVEDKDSEEELKSMDNHTPYYDTPLGQDKDSPSDKGRVTPQKAASPLVIQWLQDNYEAAEGTSLPRSTLYTHYVSFCNSMTIEPVNAASFGKLIRSIFPNLKTRRLGTRGHSKYHYYGIRIKATSELRLPNFGGSGGMGVGTAASTGGMVTNSVVVGSSGVPVGVGISGGVKIKQRNRGEYDSTSDKLLLTGSGGGTSSSSRMEEQGGMYDISGINSNFTIGATNVQLPEFSLPETLNLSGEFSMEMCHTFMTSYRAHCQALVDSTYKHHFMDVDKLLQHFWQSLPSQYRILVSTPDVVDLIIEKDQLTYKAIATVLLPNVLQSLPVSIPQSIRQFAKQLEIWLANSLDGLPQNLVIKKMNVVKKFSQSLHKQASLNHLTQAARAVLQNTTQVSQMIIDWNRLDFEFIKDQATWICQCGEDFILSAQEDFKRFLTERASLEQWAQWLQEIVHKIIGKTNDARELVLLSQQLLLKWSFYSTLIIRDLTIRNASSFGSFHLLRTLFDEYIFYLVETKFASLVHHQYPQQQQQQQHHNMPIHQQQQQHPMHHSHLSHNISTGSSSSNTSTSTGNSSNPMGIHHPSTYEATIEGYSHGHHNGHNNNVVSNMDSFSLDSLLNKDSNSLRSKHLPSPFDSQQQQQHIGSSTTVINTPNNSTSMLQHHQQLHHENTNPTSLEEYNSMLHSDINNMIHLQAYGSGYSQQQQQQQGPNRLPYTEDIRIASSASTSSTSSSSSNTNSNDLKRSNENLLKSSQQQQQQQIVYGLPANSPNNVTTSDPLRTSTFMSHYDTLLASSTPSNTSPLHYSDNTPNSKKLRIESNEHVK